MSELIELRREHTIREYECMKHLKLFTDKEIRDIKSKRLQHDYKVERRSKNLADFINYITYECNLFDLLLERRKKLRIKAEWASLEKSIHHRIRVLYKRALTRFASEYRVWTHFMRYCQMRRFITEGSRVLDRLLSYHGDKPKAWLSAINWEYRQAKNLTRAKHYTLRGLQRHPECRELCLTFIGILLAEAENIVQQYRETAEEMIRKKNPELSKTLKTAQLVYNTFELKDVEFFQQLFEELTKFRPLSDALTNEAMGDMRTSLSEKEAMWDLLANLALQGNEFVMMANYSKCEDRLTQCIELYQDAIARLPTKTMYTFYIEAMLKINVLEDDGKDGKAKRKALANAFKQALSVDLLEEEKMTLFIRLLLHNPTPKDDLIMEVINKGLERYPKSADIWLLYLRYLIQKEVDPEQLDIIFRQAVSSLPDSSSQLPFWKILFQYYCSRTDLSGKAEELLHSAIALEPEISHHFQPLFLDHLMMTKSGGITPTRCEYQRMVKSYTTPLALHRRMASLEAVQIPTNYSAWRRCHENATQLFGKVDHTVWLEYIKFERDNGDAKQLPTLYERAKATLDNDTFAVFLPEYEMLKNPLL